MKITLHPNQQVPPLRRYPTFAEFALQSESTDAFVSTQTRLTLTEQARLGSSDARVPGVPV